MNFYEEPELRLLMQTLLWHFLTRIFNHLSSRFSEGRDQVVILSIFFSLSFLSLFLFPTLFRYFSRHEESTFKKHFKNVYTMKDQEKLKQKTVQNFKPHRSLEGYYRAPHGKICIIAVSMLIIKEYQKIWWKILSVALIKKSPVMFSIFYSYRT